MNVNKVILAGRLTRDVEIRYTDTKNTAVANIGFACNRRFKRGEEWVEEPVFLDVTMFGKRAEVLARTLGKGDEVYFEGELSLDQWEDRQTGAPRQKIKVIAQEFQYVGGRKAQGQGNTPRGTDYPSSAAPPGADDTPF